MILVVGANGYIGKAVCKELLLRGQSFKGVVRELDLYEDIINPKNLLQVGDINKITDWRSILSGIDYIIHTATPAHFLQHEMNSDDYRNLSLEGIRRLTKEAAISGVKKLVYISSIKVNGQRTIGLQENYVTSKQVKNEFTISDDPAPKDPYGIFKWEAEQLLWEISEKTELEVVVIRPPLVYGPYVKGNLGRLLNLVKTGIPLPLGAVQNKRSFIGLDNLVDILIRCLENSATSGKTLLVSDGEDLSTPDLLNYMAAGLGRSARLFPVPVSILRFAGSVIGKRLEIDRLLDSLQVDGSHTFELLDCKPKVSVVEGIRRMVQEV